MKGFSQPGEVLTFTAPGGGVVSGTGKLIGGIFTIPLITVAAGEKFTGQVTGVVDHAKVSAQAWTEGQRIYWNAGLGQMTSVPTDGPQVGVAAAAAVNPSAIGQVYLGGLTELTEGQQAAVPSLTMTVGTADDTIADVGAAFNQATLNNNFRDVGEKINMILTRLRDAGVIAP